MGVSFSPEVNYRLNHLEPSKRESFSQKLGALQNPSGMDPIQPGTRGGAFVTGVTRDEQPHKINIDLV